MLNTLTILLFLNILNCSQVTNNNQKEGISSEEMGLLTTLTLQVNNNITNNVNVSTGGSGNTVVTTVDNNSNEYVYSGTTSVSTGNGSALSDLQQFRMYEFFISTRADHWNYANNECNSRLGYKMVSIKEFIIFVKLIDYTSLNYNKVPTVWQIYWETLVNLRGNRFWLSDTGGLYSDDLAYLATINIYTTPKSWSFNYADTNFNFVFNKNYERGVFGLCYKLK